MKLVDLDSLWKLAMEQVQEQVTEMKRAKGAEFGGPKNRVARATARRAWKEVRGPFSATALTLARLGWSSRDAFTFEDDLGRAICLTTCTPNLVNRLLKEGARRQMERHVAYQWAGKDNSFLGRRVCTELAEQELHKAVKHGTLNKREAGCYRAGACGAVMTNERAKNLGYEVQDICPLCGEAGDSLHHRVYGCAATRGRVSEVVPWWFLNEAFKALVHEKFWQTGIFPHSEDDHPWPCGEIEAVFSGKGVDDNGVRNDDWDLGG